MAIRLPPPPRESKDPKQVEQWLETAWRYVRPNATTSGDTNATIPDGSTHHAITALTAPRTVTLPLAKTMLDGESIVVIDESGTAASHTITIAAGAGDAVRGLATITTNYGQRTITKRGAGLFFSA